VQEMVHVCPHQGESGPTRSITVAGRGDLPMFWVCFGTGGRWRRRGKRKRPPHLGRPFCAGPHQMIRPRS